MFDLFKNTTEEQHADVKAIRHALLQAIKDQLRKAEGGEGGNIRAIQLFITCKQEDKPVYESAVYLHEEERLRNEIQRIADDYAIDLPQQWNLEIAFTETAPAEAVAVAGTAVSLFISTKQHVVQKNVTAYIKIRNGEAEKSIYSITSTSGKINIGRERKVQTADGFYRENHIAFPETSNASNKFVSRQHAHIEFDQEGGHFCLFADEGGVPPRNKIKVRSAGDGQPIKLYSTHLGHPLKEGDQVLLGESALIEFSFSAEDKQM
jgi:hypothetical protein